MHLFMKFVYEICYKTDTALPTSP